MGGRRREGISLDEARRALYIDFEGTQKDPPSLLGVAWAADDGRLEFLQYVLERTLWPAAEATSARIGWTCRPALWTDILELKERAEAEDRRIFAWSNHERDVLVELGPDEGWFAHNVVDAKVLAKAWLRKHHPHVTFERDLRRGRHQLARYLGLLDYKVPKAFGPGNSASRIRAVREGLVTHGGSYPALGSATKGKWTKALKHNWYDCMGLREVVLQCASGFDAGAASAHASRVRPAVEGGIPTAAVIAGGPTTGVRSARLLQTQRDPGLR